MAALREYSLLKRSLGAGLAGLWIALVCGCQTVSVPEISPALKAAGKTSGATESSLQSGRRVYTTQCIACHGPQRIDKYSSKEWQDIVDKMGRKAKLTSSQKTDLLAFVLAARKAAP